jgi:hypothetical protein
MNHTQIFELCKNLNIFRKLEKNETSPVGRNLLVAQWHSIDATGLSGPRACVLLARRFRGSGSSTGHGGATRGSGDKAVRSTMSSAQRGGAEPDLGRAETVAAALTRGARRRWRGLRLQDNDSDDLRGEQREG